MSTAAASMFRGCRALMSSSAAAAAAAAAGIKTGRSAAAAAVAKRKVSTNADAAASKQLRGIMGLVQASDALREFSGAAYISRAGAVQSVVNYVKENDLQNPVSKREIICDAKLKTIFPGRDMVDMMDIIKLLSPHFVKSE